MSRRLTALAIFACSPLAACGAGTDGGPGHAPPSSSAASTTTVASGSQDLTFTGALVSHVTSAPSDARCTVTRGSNGSRSLDETWSTDYVVPGGYHNPLTFRLTIPEYHGPGSYPATHFAFTVDYRGIRAPQTDGAALGGAFPDSQAASAGSVVVAEGDTSGTIEVTLAHPSGPSPYETISGRWVCAG